MPRLGSSIDFKHLEAQFEDVKRRSQDLKASMRKERKQHKEMERRRAYAELVALNILCQSSGDKSSAKHFLDEQLAEHGRAVIDRTFVIVTTTYDNMPVDERSDLQEAAPGMKSTPVTRKAAKFLKEYKLAQWVQDRNMKQNIAPVTSLVAKEAVKSGLLQSKGTPCKQKSENQWLRRFRRRWNITMGRIPAREHVPPEERRDKVSVKRTMAASGPHFCAHFVRLWIPMETEKGSTIWARFWAHERVVYKELGPHSGPLFLLAGRHFPFPRQKRSGVGQTFCTSMLCQARVLSL